MPYETFLDLVDECKKCKILKTWNGSNPVNYYNGKIIYPVELLVLYVLRYLARGLTMDDLQECTAINAETISTFKNIIIVP